MANSLTGKVTTSVLSTHTLDGDLTDAVDKLNSYKISETTINNGTGAQKAQVHWHDEFTLTSSANVTLDLAALVRNIGGTITFTKVKYFALKLVTATTGYKASVEAGASNGFEKLFANTSDIAYIGADGIFHVEAWTDGMVVDSTHKTLKITSVAGAATMTLRIIIIGEGSVA